MKTKYLLPVIVLAVVCMASSSDAVASVIYSVVMDKSLYQEMEPIQISINAFNPDDIPDTMWVPFSPAYYTMDGVYDWRTGKFFPPSYYSLEIPAHGTHTWDFQHPLEDYFPGPGSHSVSGYFGGSFVQTVGFTVVPEPSTMLMLMIGSAGLLIYKWRRK
jgi:hypothetical protein